MTPKEGVELKEAEARLDRVVEALESEGLVGARASVAEKPGEAMLLIGWKTTDVRTICYIYEDNAEKTLYRSARLWARNTPSFGQSSRAKSISRPSRSSSPRATFKERDT